MEFIKSSFMSLWGVIASMKFPTDYIDILLVAVLLYYCIKIIRDVRAGQLLKGIALIFVIMQVARILNLSALDYIISNLLQYGFLAVIVMFQPELRTVLEKIGRTNLRNINIFNTQKDRIENKVTHIIDQVCECCRDLSARRIGGLIVFERSTKIGDIINTGISVDSDVSSQMLGTIFFPNTPLHDGAVIIRDYRIAAAGCLLPLSQRMEISSSLGTRHRAAVGVSEISDALTIVISEETGRISYTYNSKISIGVSVEELKTVMSEILTPETQVKLFSGREDNNA